MADTTVEQVRVAIEPIPGTVKYRITSTVTDEGDMPFKEIFVYQINDPVDASNDTFKRVANPNDLENLTPDRVTAVANDESYFMWSVLVRDYKSIETAVQAIGALEGRINTAVTTWVTYQTSFVTGSEIDTYPSADEELSAELKAAYAAAKAARITAEGVVTTADTDLLLAQAEAVLAIERVALYQTEVQFCDDARITNWLSYYPAVQTFQTAGGTFHTGSAAFSADVQSFIDAVIAVYDAESGEIFPGPNPANAWTGIWAALNSSYLIASSYDASAFSVYTTALSTFQLAEGYGTQVDNLLAAFCSAANAGYNAAAANKSMKDQAAASAVTAKEEAEAALASAQTAEDEALAAALALCPDFDPASV